MFVIAITSRTFGSRHATVGIGIGHCHHGEWYGLVRQYHTEYVNDAASRHTVYINKDGI